MSFYPRFADGQQDVAGAVSARAGHTSEADRTAFEMLERLF
jgi:hypothetical protein